LLRKQQKTFGDYFILPHPVDLCKTGNMITLHQQTYHTLPNTKGIFYKATSHFHICKIPSVSYTHGSRFTCSGTRVLQ